LTIRVARKLKAIDVIDVLSEELFVPAFAAWPAALPVPWLRDYQDTKFDDNLNSSMFWSSHVTNMMERNWPWRALLGETKE